MAGGIARCAFSAQKRRSQQSASARPPPIEEPSSAAIVGTVERDQRLEADFDRAEIFARGRGVAKDRVELGNVRAGAEMAAGPLDDDHARVLAPLDLGAEFRQSAPHRERHRVAALGAREAQARQRRLEGEGEFAHVHIAACHDKIIGA